MRATAGGSNWVYTAALVICIALLPSPGAAAKSTDYNKPPDGITPTTTRLSDVLDAADKASAKVKRWTTDIEEGQVSMWGLKGTYRDVYAGDDYKHTVNLGSVSWQSGSLNGQRWRQNENGLVIMMNATSRPDETDASALAQYTKDRDHLTLLGETSTANPAYVIQQKSKHGLYKWLFIDKTTYRLVRVEAAYPDGRVTYTFSDFRKTGPYTEAWHFHSADKHSQNDEDWTITSDRYDTPVKPADLAMPESNANLVEFPAGARTVKLPVKIVDGDIVVRLNIGDRGLDFILDSGSSGIAIDSDVARQLGLQRFGESVETTAGSYIQTRAIVPDLRVGDIHMKNVMVDSLPFQAEENFTTKAVGLLGYDFIANAVLKIDYQHGTVEATLPDMFVPPAEGVAFQAYLDDGVPFIPVTVGSSTGDHFILDTGATDGVIFSTFADAHPDDIKDQGRGREISGWLPFVYSQGVGGLVKMKALEVKTFTLGGLTFADWLVFQTVANHAFEGEDTDGLVGYDFLKFFDVYLDYRQNMVFLVPNDLAKRSVGRKIPGE